MPQHANRGVLKHAARGCGSGRGGYKRWVREGRKRASMSPHITNVRSRPSRRRSTSRASRVSPYPTGMPCRSRPHGMCLCHSARVEQFRKSKGAPPLYVSGRERALRAALEASPPRLDSRAARSGGRRSFHSSRTAVAMVANMTRPRVSPAVSKKNFQNDGVTDSYWYGRKFRLLFPEYFSFRVERKANYHYVKTGNYP